MGLTNAQYDEIMREYDKKRIQAGHRLDMRQSQVYERIPEYTDVEEEISDIACECGKRSIEGDETALDEMRRRISELSERKTSLLVENGFPADFLEPVYECPDCKDTGYIGSQKCHCLKQRILKLLYSKSNVGDILIRENFNTLSYDLYTDDEASVMKPIIDKCKSYAENFGEKCENLILTGKPGVGKTFLTNCIAKSLLDDGYSVIYFTSVQLFDTLSAYTYSYDYSEESTGMREDICSCDLLIIDDLGTELTTNFVLSKLFYILNERDVRGKATIISTNLMLKDISERYSERAFSRLIGKYTWLSPDISDMRFKSKKNSIQGK